ncbi:hypothetical protein [Streptomyces sp. NPDC047061]|uniref:hypothetical protein n=1 Tax=Streptomyces sp. NPDC047061 TaxID=3154605 RepID=UPI0033C6B0DB
MDSAWGTALIALAGTLVGAALSLFGGILQQKRNEKATEANRRTALREASLDRITEELFAVVRLSESAPSSHTSAEDHTAWERTLREHLTRIEMASLRLENPLRATINDMSSLLLNDRDRLAPMAWPHQVVAGATRHAIDSIGAFQRGETLPAAGPTIQRLWAAREVADENERVAAEEARRNSSP